MEASHADLSSCSVLVIDDDEIIRMIVRDGLIASGCTVLEAGDPETGLAHAHGAQPDVIVLDIMLPRIDGLALLERMKREGVRSSVIVFSATGTRHAERALELGADAFLPKPFELSELIDIVGAARSRRQAA